MDPIQLRKAITEVLQYLDVYSPEALKLMMLTAAQETHGGKFLFQLGDGPARGIFQMEPSTEEDLWKNFLRYREDLAERIGNMMANVPLRYMGGAADNTHIKVLFRNFNLKYNLAYQIAMARMQYYRHSEPLPGTGNIEGMAQYYKKYYNTVAGAATVDEAINNYLKYA